MFIVSLLVAPAFAAEYATDVLEPGNPGGWTSSLKTNDDTYKIEAGQTIEVDIWLKNAPGSANGGGAFIDFRGYTDKISYINCQRYDNGATELPGPWQAAAGNTLNEPLGEGTLIVLVGNLSAVAPDGNGDIIIAKVTFQCLVSGTADITASVVPDLPTWAPSPPWVDATITPKTLTLGECLVNEDCNDNLFCNGEELCDNGTCVNGPDPCPDDEFWCNGEPGCDEINNLCTPSQPRCQDDGLYCNGEESCNEDGNVCEQLNVPCTPDDDDPCTDQCDEPTNTCYVCNATGPDDECCITSAACATADICVVEYNDFYVDGTNGDNLNDGLTPATAWKTITHALNQVPSVMVLDDQNRAIVHVAASTYDTLMGGGDAETFPLIMVKYISLVGDDGYAGTIIDAEGTDNVIEFTKEADSGDTITLDGFTITGGVNFRGGGITVLWADPLISNCYVKDNIATDINGGGIYLQRSNARIYNCIIENNSANQQRGGGISCGNISSPDIINCTIVGNSCGCDTDESGGGISVGEDSAPSVMNTILWGNYRNCSPDPELNQILEQEGSLLTITYCCIQGGGFAGAGNTDQDPKFFGTGYHLMYGSSCIDSGDSGLSMVIPDTDIDKNERFDHCPTPDTGVGPFTYYDRGAREFQGDSDLDGIPDDGDSSCIIGDNPCSGGATENCDDNCLFDPNPGQEDADSDGLGDLCDNCINYSNGPLRGTCTKTTQYNYIVSTGQFCTEDTDCDDGEYCEKWQADNYPPGGNGIGDACDCEGNFDCDDGVTSADLAPFLDDWNQRNIYSNPCTNEDPCTGDFNCNGGVGADDVGKFLEDFNQRNTFNNPCPPCAEGAWCNY